jgi:hypothetical protein
MTNMITERGARFIVLATTTIKLNSKFRRYQKRGPKTPYALLYSDQSIF